MAKPTLAMVAERAGVSVATVSRSLHGDPAVVADTRAHVLQVCKDIGYAPSMAGRRLKQGNKAVVGLSLGARDHAAGRYVALMHQALSHQLARSGWSVELIHSVDFHRGLDVGGLILIGVQIDDPRSRALSDSRLPVVSVGHDAPGFRVAPDDAAGAALAIGHLLQSGRTRLAIVAARDASGNFSLRILSALASARAAGVEPILLEMRPQTTPALEGYRTIARAIAGGGAAFDGLFCETDETALGALAALEDAGISVPGEVALIGFDDLPEFAGRLTTIRQDIPQIAGAAMGLLDEARQGRNPRAVLLPVQLMKRETA